MTITRRDFVSASSAFVLAAGFGARARAAPLPREADIVVIGAGAAGIAAAKRAIAAGRKVIVLEATGQIGGRWWPENPHRPAQRARGRDGGVPGDFGTCQPRDR
jgi:NADPH-dependent 2,4-dienoyl-CoA reductase/sulfur reductase-like enzyme